MKPAPLVPRIIAAFIDAIITNVLCLVVIGIVYGLFADALPFLKGQSIGKKIMKIKCVMEDGSSMEGQWVPCLIRRLFAIIWPVELYFMAVQNKETGIRLGDQFAKTKVISCE